MAGNSGSTTSNWTTVWIVENFSCWNEYVHGNVIENHCNIFKNDPKICLYPIGGSLTGGNEFCVHLFLYRRITFGELSIHNSSGVILSKEFKSDIQIPIGQTFQRVAHPNGNTQDIQDIKIILKCRIWGPEDEVTCMRTTIEVFDTNLKIPAELFNKCDLLLPVCISRIEYLRNNNTLDSMSVTISHDGSKIAFSLKPSRFNGNTLVFVTMDNGLPNGVNLIDENSHLFQDGKKWVFLSSLSRADFKKGLTLNLNVLIVPSNNYLHDLGHGSVIRRRFKVHIFPTTSSIPTGSCVSEVSLVQPGNSKDILAEDLTCLYRDQDFSDFQLRCGDVTFPVHKNILSARSTVFKTMLSSDMREIATGAVDITDLDAATVDLFLTHLYAGTDLIDLQWESALELYHAADKYLVPSLKAKCASVLGTGLCIDNVCDLLSFADKYQDASLSTAAQNFIVSNYCETLRSENWKSFMESQPVLAVKTVTGIAEKNFEKSDVCPPPPKQQKL